MQKRILGNSGIEVSALGLGCMGFSHAYGKPTEKKEAIKTLQQAVDMGYTFFDTAEIYGTYDNPYDNETLLGEAFEHYQDLVIASKFGIRFDLEAKVTPYPIIPDASPERIRKSIDGSLKRLKRDYLDIYYQHRIDPRVEPETVAEVMAELIKAGKIRSWGISEANEEYLRRAHAVCPVTAIENRYSMMARWHESLFPLLEELNIAFVAFSPMANGLLTGKYGKGTTYDKEFDYRSKMPQFTDEGIEKNRELLELIAATAQKHKATSAQISLAWMLCKKPYIIPIPGSRKIERLMENAGSASVLLTAEEIAELDDKLEKISMSDVFGGTKIIQK
ncbi:MAG: aldo/keto reductase [Phascolarctobacterium sp.]|nr:aldo/keto reductase [Phascolarctobacterium sp.]